MAVQVAVLGWQLAGSRYGTDVRTIVHVEENLEIQELVHARAGFLGVVFYREHMVPVIDMAYALSGVTTYKWSSSERYLIFHDLLPASVMPNFSVRSVRNLYAGKVDSVMRIFQVSTDDLQESVDSSENRVASFTRAIVDVESERLRLIDMRRLVYHLTADSDLLAEYGGMQASIPRS